MGEFGGYLQQQYCKGSEMQTKLEKIGSGKLAYVVRTMSLRKKSITYTAPAFTSHPELS